MNKSLLVAAMVSFSACAAVPAAHAGTVIPYPTPGTQNSETYTFTAVATGSIQGFLYSANAADVDSIAMSVNGGPLGAFGLVNTSPVGTSFNFGNVTIGDTLTFTLHNANTGTNRSSNPAANSDGIQYAYSAPYTNPGPFAISQIPGIGTFVAFEDLTQSLGSDFDYNDDTFVFTNLVAQRTDTTPIPATLPLFASGLGLGVVALRRRRKMKVQAA